MAIYVRRYNASAVLGNDLTSSTGAPALTGLAGTLISVLDYCLTDATYGIGWTKAYTGTNKAVYRQPTSGANGFYLAVDDSVGINATVAGFESMTGVSAGSGQFPTTAQNATLQSGWNLAVYKSSTADTTARSWQFFSNGKIFYLVVYNTGTSASNIFIFGDYVSYKSGDQFNTIIGANTSLSATTASCVLTNIQSWNATSYVRQWGARSHSQAGTSVWLPVVPSPIQTGYYGGGGEAYPNQITGGLSVSPLWVAEYNVGLRGALPGIWCPVHTRPFATGDVFAGNGDIAGKTFEVGTSGGSGVSQFFFETSDTWATS